MATEQQANTARNIHADQIRNLGAHGIGVDQVKVGNKKTFAVIAFTEKPIPGLPKTLPVKTGTQTLEVPLVTRISAPFKPE